jgi:hypothetical protein
MVSFSDPTEEPPPSQIDTGPTPAKLEVAKRSGTPLGKGIKKIFSRFRKNK